MMMDFYLIRHGEAEPLNSPGVQCDADRALTRQGKKDVKRIATGLKKVMTAPNMILTSPLVRAVETAEIVRDIFGLPSDALQKDERLAPGGSSQNLLQAARATGRDRIALVGHEPDCSRFVSSMTCGHSQGGVVMKKGAVARINLNGEKSELIWLLPPKITKALAE